MKKKPGVVLPEDEADYYGEAVDWNAEKYESAKQRSDLWKWIAMTFAAIALLEAFGFMGLAPLKTAVPYVIKVDQSTGIVEIVQPLQQSDVPQDEALTKYWIVQYMNAREQYDLQSFENDSYLVSKMSSTQIFNDYSVEFAPSQKNSPYALYGDRATIKIYIKSISFLDDDTAVINFRRDVKKAQEVSSSYWVTTLSFKYLLNPQAESDRFLNPLGFQVVSYRKDPVVL